MYPEFEGKKGDDLFEAAKKLIFAEYLLDREDANVFLTAAKQHICGAARQVLKILTGLNDNYIESPQIAGRVIKKFDNQTVSKFFDFYNKLKKSGNFEDKEEASNALNKVKEFITWVENNKGKLKNEKA